MFLYLLGIDSVAPEPIPPVKRTGPQPPVQPVEPGQVPSPNTTDS